MRHVLRNRNPRMSYVPLNIREYHFKTLRDSKTQRSPDPDNEGGR